MASLKIVEKHSWRDYIVVGAAILAALCLVMLVVQNQRSNDRIDKSLATGYILGCKHTNALAHGLSDEGLEARRRTADAILKNPASTGEQKFNARVNLATLQAYITKLNLVASDKLCVWPPVPINIPKPTVVIPTTNGK